jgi:peptidylprolyl isomerase
MGYVKGFDIIEIRYPENVVSDPEKIVSTDMNKLEISIGQKKEYLDFFRGTTPMAIGNRKTITVPPEEAFGPKRRELIIEVEKKWFPDTASPTKEQTVRVEQQNGKMLDTSIVDVKEDSIVLDANHPLAGKTLIFDLEFVAVSY